MNPLSGPISSFSSLLKCHFHREAFPDHPVWSKNSLLSQTRHAGCSVLAFCSLPNFVITIWLLLFIEDGSSVTCSLPAWVWQAVSGGRLNVRDSPGSQPTQQSAEVGRAHSEPYIVCAEKKQIQKQYEIVQIKAAIQKCLVVIFTKKKKRQEKRQDFKTEWEMNSLFHYQVVIIKQLY